MWPLVSMFLISKPSKVMTQKISAPRLNPDSLQLCASRRTLKFAAAKSTLSLLLLLVSGYEAFAKNALVQPVQKRKDTRSEPPTQVPETATKPTLTEVVNAVLQALIQEVNQGRNHLKVDIFHLNSATDFNTGKLDMETRIAAAKTIWSPLPSFALFNVRKTPITTSRPNVSGEVRVQTGAEIDIGVQTDTIALLQWIAEPLVLLDNCPATVKPQSATNESDNIGEGAEEDIPPLHGDKFTQHYDQLSCDFWQLFLNQGLTVPDIYSELTTLRLKFENFIAVWKGRIDQISSDEQGQLRDLELYLKNTELEWAPCDNCGISGYGPGRILLKIKPNVFKTNDAASEKTPNTATPNTSNSTATTGAPTEPKEFQFNKLEFSLSANEFKATIGAEFNVSETTYKDVFGNYFAMIQNLSHPDTSPEHINTRIFLSNLLTDLLNQGEALLSPPK